MSKHHPNLFGASDTIIVVGWLLISIAAILGVVAIGAFSQEQPWMVWAGGALASGAMGTKLAVSGGLIKVAVNTEENTRKLAELTDGLLSTLSRMEAGTDETREDVRSLIQRTKVR